MYINAGELWIQFMCNDMQLIPSRKAAILKKSTNDTVLQKGLLCLVLQVSEHQGGKCSTKLYCKKWTSDPS